MAQNAQSWSILPLNPPSLWSISGHSDVAAHRKSESCTKVISQCCETCSRPEFTWRSSKTCTHACHGISYTTAVAIASFLGSFKDLLVGFSYEARQFAVLDMAFTFVLRLMSRNEFHGYIRLKLPQQAPLPRSIIISREILERVNYLRCVGKFCEKNLPGFPETFRELLQRQTKHLYVNFQLREITTATYCESLVSLASKRNQNKYLNQQLSHFLIAPASSENHHQQPTKIGQKLKWMKKLDFSCHLQHERWKPRLERERLLISDIYKRADAIAGRSRFWN